IKIQGTGFPRRLAGAGQVFPAREPVDERRFSHVGAPGQRDFRPFMPGKLARGRGAHHEVGILPAAHSANSFLSVHDHSPPTAVDPLPTVPRAGTGAIRGVHLRRVKTGPHAWGGAGCSPHPPPSPATTSGTKGSRSSSSSTARGGKLWWAKVRVFEKATSSASSMWDTKTMSKPRRTSSGT